MISFKCHHAHLREKKKSPPTGTRVHSLTFHLFTHSLDGATIASGCIRALKLHPVPEIVREKHTLFYLIVHIEEH